MALTGRTNNKYDIPGVSGDSPFTKPLSELTSAINALSQCSDPLLKTYYVQSNNPYFGKYRTELFYEAKLYGDRILPRTLGLIDSFRYITSTTYEAIYSASPWLIRDLISKCENAEQEAKTLALSHSAIAERIGNIESSIMADRKRSSERRGYGARNVIMNVFRAVTAWEATGGAQEFDILQTALVSLRNTVGLLQRCVQSIWDLTLSIRRQRGQNLHGLFISNRSHSGNLSYLEIIGPGKVIAEEYGRFRNEYKIVMEVLLVINVTVPDPYRVNWHWHTTTGHRSHEA